MYKRLFLFLLFYCFGLLTIQAQMINGTDSLYGDEWIQYDQSYYKFKVAEDGVVRITQNKLVQTGIDINEISGEQFQIYAYGEEIPIFTSTAGTFNTEDYIEFFARKNRGFLDKYLYQNWEEEQLNPKYSIYTDTMTYYLTWNSGTNNKRYTLLENNLAGNIPDVESHYNAISDTVFSRSYIKGSYNGSSHIRYSNFDIIEGYGSSFKFNHKYSITANHISDIGDNPKLTIRTAGSNKQHDTEFTINDQLIHTNSYYGYKVSNLELDFDKAYLSETNTIKIKEDNTTQRTTLAYLELHYSRMFNAENKSKFDFNIPIHSQKKYFEIQDFDHSGNYYILYDFNNNQRLVSQYNNNIPKFILPPTTKARKISLINEQNAIRYISHLEAITFTDYTDINPNYLILTSAALNSDKYGTNQIEAYADYRSSEKGGDYEVYIINIEKLYDQFSYGISNHPLAIRNFSNRMRNQWTNWQQVFIIGRGLRMTDYRTPSQILENNIYFHVPTYGKTGSDNLLFSIVNQNNPQVAVGRLAAINGDEIKNYLDKIKVQEDYELLSQNIKDKLWTKNVLHLGGGNGASQQKQFRDKLNSLKTVIEENMLGSSVKSYFKTSSDIIQSATTNDLIDYIDNGVSIISFLGHSSVGSFDFNIEQVDAYNNKDKYPILLSMGCYSGNIHKKNGGLSQEFVLKKDKGVIAFTASVGTAYAKNLTQFAKDFYSLIGGDMYGEPIGNIWKEVYKIHKDNKSIGSVTLMQQNTLHGDPAITLYPYKAPDYIVDYESIELNPKIISSADDSYILSFDIVNLGKSINDSIDFHLWQVTDEDSTLFNITKRIIAPSNRKHFQITIPIEKKSLSIGENTIFLDIDTQNEIEESPNPIAEQNNSLTNNQDKKGYKFYIVDNNIRTIYPPQYGIANQRIKLYASVANLFVNEQSYVLQIDTTAKFQNPLAQDIITQKGGLLTWEPNIVGEHEQVYYWRVSPDSTNSSIGYIWSTSSFVFHNELNEGWNQSHANQLQENSLHDLTINNQGNIDFKNNLIPYQFINRWRESDKYPSYIINNSVVDYNNGIDIKSGVFVIVSDTLFAKPWTNASGGEYGSDTPVNAGTREVFPFKTETETDRIELMDFLENTIPDGLNVIIMNIQSQEFPSNADQWNEDFDNLGRSIFSILEKQGAKKVFLLKDEPTLPYIFAYRKNHSVLEEIISDSPNGVINKVIYCVSKWHKGHISTKLIGPVSAWNTLTWEATHEDTDEAYIEIELLDNTKKIIGTRTITELGNSSYDLSDIKTTETPYLRLHYYSKDSLNHTSPQLHQWRISYLGIPELAIDPEQNFNFHADTIYQGEQMTLAYAITNVSKTNIDSFNIRYEIIDKNNNIISEIQKSDGIPAESSILHNYEFDTKDMNADFSFNVFINKENTPAEQKQFNNTLFKKIVLLKDHSNPLLDVRFDGIHIANDELVSSQTEISIQLKDYNDFLLIDNPDAFSISLTTPDNTTNKIDLNSTEIQFEAATTAKNTAFIKYKPNLTQSGEYTLEVNGKDVSGNTSGDQAYTVRFKIQLEQSISNVLNYPNPFSSHTQFVFQLGGEELPHDFSIRILSISGKVVKEITAEEFGNIHLGTNKSEYLWDGTDDYGMPLANGTYLYQVNITKSNGEAYKKNATKVDEYFKEGWGKLTIIR